MLRLLHADALFPKRICVESCIAGFSVHGIVVEVGSRVAADVHAARGSLSAARPAPVLLIEAEFEHLVARIPRVPEELVQRVLLLFVRQQVDLE